MYLFSFSLSITVFFADRLRCIRFLSHILIQSRSIVNTCQCALSGPLILHQHVLLQSIPSLAELSWPRKCYDKEAVFMFDYTACSEPRSNCGAGWGFRRNTGSVSCHTKDFILKRETWFYIWGSEKWMAVFTPVLWLIVMASLGLQIPRQMHTHTNTHTLEPHRTHM